MSASKARFATSSIFGRSMDRNLAGMFLWSVRRRRRCLSNGEVGVAARPAAVLNSRAGVFAPPVTGIGSPGSTLDCVRRIARFYVIVPTKRAMPLARTYPFRTLGRGSPDGRPFCKPMSNCRKSNSYRECSDHQSRKKNAVTCRLQPGTCGAEALSIAA
jgi:hypothetical protein